MLSAVLASLLLAGTAAAHQVVWHSSMWCLNGTKRDNNQNTNDAVNPLYQHTKQDWWMHHYQGCDQFPPAPGEFLELPVGKDITVEIAQNRGPTTYSYGGKFAGEWPDGLPHEELNGPLNGTVCISSPNLHAGNETMAAGTAFAISYTSDITQVTPENLAVFTVAYHTPWKRLTNYSIPEQLPPCPDGGCICVWGWVPNGCGEPNIFLMPYRCKVTGSTATNPVAQAKPPVWCEDDPSKCVHGAKQMIYWHQLEGNNIEVSGQDLSGGDKHPGYNAKCGFTDGAQNDIFKTGTATPSKSKKAHHGHVAHKNRLH